MKKGKKLLILLLAGALLLLSGCQSKVQHDAKPVIYLYPEEPTEVTVTLDYSGELTYTYPAYGDGWTVTAYPDGTLIDADGKEYSYLLMFRYLFF